MNTSIIDGFFTQLLKLSRHTGLKSTVQLMSHQESASQKTLDRDGNILLAHGVGTGKTLTAIASFEKLKEHDKAHTALVVVPASLRENFVQNGVRRFTNSKVVIIGNTSEIKSGGFSSLDNIPKADYYVVSYEMFRKNPAQYIKNTKADTVIYDELHKIKNDNSITYEAIKAIRPLHRNFIGLTGSVISNNPSDIVPLIDSMTNGEHKLGNKASFRMKFLGVDRHGNWLIKKPDELKKLISPHIDFVENIQGRKMPEKILAEEYVQMSPHQSTLYKHVIDGLIPIFENNGKKLNEREIAGVFGRIIKARQASNSINTIDPTYTLSRSAKETPKVKKLLDDVMEHIAETPDAQVVLHSQLVHGGFDVLQQGLRDRGIDPAVFIGKGNPGITEAGRQQGVKDYLHGKKKAIIISGAGTEGLSLSNTTMVASLDGHFNPEVLAQAEARGVRVDSLTHRPESHRKVLVKRYYSVLPSESIPVLSKVFSYLNPVNLYRKITNTQSTAVPFSDVLKRRASTDEWIQNVAQRKADINTEVKGLLNKQSSEDCGFYTDDILDMILNHNPGLKT